MVHSLKRRRYVLLCACSYIIISFIPSSHLTRSPAQFPHPQISSIVHQFVVASAFVTFLVIIVFVGIGSGWMVLEVPPVAGFIILALAMLLMAYVEALHYSCVNLVNANPEEFEGIYPGAAAAQRQVNTQTKMKQFLLGRQGFVIAIVFITAQLTNFGKYQNSQFG